MSVRQAIAAASNGRVVLLVAAEGPEEIAGAWDSAVVVDARDLAYDRDAELPERLVVAHAEALAGLDPDAWCGPWHLLEWLGAGANSGVILHSSTGHPVVARNLSGWFDLEIVGDVEDVAPAALEPVSEDELRGAYEIASRTPWLDAEPALADLLLTLARTGHLGGVWRVPFLIRVANDRRFVEPFVGEHAEVAAFFAAHESLVLGLGMLQAAEYRLRGRQPKDLRRLATALDMPLRRVGRVFRIMDRLGVVVNKPFEEGVGERPNLEIQLGDKTLDLAAAAADVAAVWAARAPSGVDAPATPASPVVPSAGEPHDLASGLFASLADLPAVEPSAWPPTERRLAPARKPPVREAPIPDDLPGHLPGLEALVRGDLGAARAALAEVNGPLRSEATLLGAFRYELIDAQGLLTRRFQIPAELQPVVLRALELEDVPEDRSRATLDSSFPEAFAEVPRTGLVEVFYDEGPLKGTHRFTELVGRRAFESDKLTGARAVQAELAAGRFVSGDPGDPGWAHLAEALRLRDAGDSVAAWEALRQVDVDVDLDDIGQEILVLLPEDHDERIALMERIAAEQVRRSLGPILDRMGRALAARGQDELPGHEAVEMAAEAGVVPQLVEFLGTRAAENARDPGPHLWLGRLHVQQEHVEDAEEAYNSAVALVENPSLKAEWTFELGECALTAGFEPMWWRLLRLLLNADPNPRAVDHNLARLFDDGLLGKDHTGPLRKLLDKHGGPRRYPKVRDRVKPPEEVDDWKKALLGLKLGR